MKKFLLILLFPMIAVSQEQRTLDVFFDFDKYVLTNEAVGILESTLQENPDIVVTKIYGYCDWKGSSGYNDTLSLKRVREVFHFLRNKGVKIKPDYESKGFGKNFEQSEVQSENRKVTVAYEQIVPQQSLDYRKALKDLVSESKVGDKIKLKDINFRNHSAVIVPQSKMVLYDLLCVMEENPKLKIEIQGHICCQTERDASDISTSRARAIYMFLLRNKIDRKRMTYKGYGITRPIHPIPEKTEAERDENRRVEIMIVEK